MPTMVRLPTASNPDRFSRIWPGTVLFDPVRVLGSWAGSFSVSLGHIPMMPCLPPSVVMPAAAMPCRMIAGGARPSGPRGREACVAHCTQLCSSVFQFGRQHSRPLASPAPAGGLGLSDEAPAEPATLHCMTRWVL